MAIKFDRNLNKRLRRAVDAYNKRLKRAENRNLKYLPSKQSVKEIKEAFKGQSAKREELKRQLKELESFNLKSATISDASSIFISIPSSLASLYFYCKS